MIGTLGDSVFSGQEQGLVVGRPFERGHALGGIGKGLTGAQILDVQGVLPVAGDVGSVRQQVRVVTDRECSQAEVGVSRG
jgi:hypothetical protein